MSTEQPARRTVVSMKDYARAVVAAWPSAEEAPVSRAAVAVLWAQYMIETGGSACWNWNIGNVKAPPGSPHDFHMLRGVWEGVTAAEAQRLIASGQAVADPSENHARAVGPGRVSVIFQPPHPATRFRAFASLDEAMVDHLALLKRRFAPGWPGVLAGDVDEFAHGLKSRGYFTASAEAYANGMRPAFRQFMASPVYDEVAPPPQGPSVIEDDAVPSTIPDTTAARITGTSEAMREVFRDPPVIIVDDDGEAQ